MVASALLASWLLAAGAGGPRPATACRQAQLEGEVNAGQPFFAPIGAGLAFYLQPITSGWIVRVVPASGPGSEPDYAELATPPYRSVTPLSISTDFSLRAQDAVGWNPRRFRFAADRAAYNRLLAAYRELPVNGSQGPRAAEQVLLQESGRGIPAEVRILDARLEAGTANQWRAAGAVASHFASTAHQVVPPADGRATPLGRLDWIRFRLTVDLPPGFEPSAGLKPGGACAFSE